MGVKTVMGKLTKKMVTYGLITFVVALVLSVPVFANEAQQEELSTAFHAIKQMEMKERSIPNKVPRFKYDSGYNFEYPDAVRGVYMTGTIAGGYQNYLENKENPEVPLYTTGRKFKEIMNLMETTDLNSVVVDIKEDNGYITTKLEGPQFEKYSQSMIKEPEKLMELFEKEGVYPIARIVVFKDTIWAEERPDVSFTENGKVWKNGKGDAFVNPFVKEVWERNVEIAKEAAKMGFQEIQFDYVRFPEGFEKRDDILSYDKGAYEDSDIDNVQRRVTAVTDFVAYAKEELDYYDVDVSVDIFGYTATLPEAPGIGQNFSLISEHVDVISSMIYPSHWGFHYFDIPEPDKEPYRLVNEYIKVEKVKLAELENPPVSRPWLQDFNAPWLYKYRGQPTMNYGPQEVEAQIRALHEEGVEEFLLWNASNNYTEGVDYTPLQ
jgi:hypothetical protein